MFFNGSKLRKKVEDNRLGRIQRIRHIKHPTHPPVAFRESSWKNSEKASDKKSHPPASCVYKRKLMYYDHVDIR